METFEQREHRRWLGINVKTSSVKIKIKQPTPTNNCRLNSSSHPLEYLGMFQPALDLGHTSHLLGFREWLRVTDLLHDRISLKNSVWETSCNTEGCENCSPIISKLQGRNVSIKWKSFILCWKFQDVPTTLLWILLRSNVLLLRSTRKSVEAPSSLFFAC